MSGIINFLRNLIYKRKGGTPSDEQPPSPEVRSQTMEPQRSKIAGEAVFGLKDGYLVVSVDHSFADIPNWVEWDAERKVVNITQVGGDMDEVYADIKDEYVDALVDMKKVLLVSNDNAKKIVHFVPFLARK